MDIRKLQRVIVNALEDVKGQDIRAFNSTGLTDLFDRVYIATGTSNRHTKALANAVREQVKAAGGDVLSMEGEEGGEWVLVDLGDAIVHIMQPPIRAYYNLEELWGEKPVALKSKDEGSDNAAKRVSRRFAEGSEEPAAAPSKKVAKKIVKKVAKKVVSKAAPSRKTATKSAAASKKPRAAKKTAS